MPRTEEPSESPMHGSWFKSSYSSAACTCVEVRLHADFVEVRDSKFALDPEAGPSPVISLSVHDWTLFLAEATGKLAAETNQSIAVRPGGAHDLTSLRCRATGIELHFDSAEWEAFLGGVEHGEFSPAPLLA